MDWIKRFFNDPATVAVLASSGIVGFVVGIANGIIQKKHGGWAGFFSATFWGGVIAMLVGLAASGYVHSEALRLALVGVCAVISDDIRAGLKALGLGMRTDPLGTVARILDALRGRSSPQPDASPQLSPKEE